MFSKTYDSFYNKIDEANENQVKEIIKSLIDGYLDKSEVYQDHIENSLLKKEAKDIKNNIIEHQTKGLFFSAVDILKRNRQFILDYNN